MVSIAKKVVNSLWRSSRIHVILRYKDWIRVTGLVLMICQDLSDNDQNKSSCPNSTLGSSPWLCMAPLLVFQLLLCFIWELQMKHRSEWGRLFVFQCGPAVNQWLDQGVALPSPHNSWKMLQQTPAEPREPKTQSAGGSRSRRWMDKS